MAFTFGVIHYQVYEIDTIELAPDTNYTAKGLLEM